MSNTQKWADRRDVTSELRAGSGLCVCCGRTDGRTDVRIRTELGGGRDPAPLCVFFKAAFAPFQQSLPTRVDVTFRALALVPPSFFFLLRVDIHTA